MPVALTAAQKYIAKSGGINMKSAKISLIIFEKQVTLMILRGKKMCVWAKNRNVEKKLAIAYKIRL